MSTDDLLKPKNSHLLLLALSSVVLGRDSMPSTPIKIERRPDAERLMNANALETQDRTLHCPYRLNPPFRPARISHLFCVEASMNNKTQAPTPPFHFPNMPRPPPFPKQQQINKHRFSHLSTPICEPSSILPS
jgi:hypothetical protein